MNLPIDCGVITFASAGPPEPVIDFGTKAQRADADGQPLWQVHLFALGSRTRDVITVKIAGEPKGIAVAEFTPVKVAGLIATTWQMEDRFGVAFRAQRLEAANIRQAAQS